MPRHEGDCRVDDAPYWNTARELFGSELVHVAVIWPLRQMRVQLADGTRLLMDEHGTQIGRTLPPI